VNTPANEECGAQPIRTSAALDASVIIVTFNSAAVVAGALASAKAILDRGGEVIVVDNASTDETCSIVNTIDERVSLVKMPSNVGFAGAVNHGARQASRGYLCLLNPDSHIDPEAIAYLTARLRTDSSIGAIAPLIEQGGSAAGNSGSYRFPTLWRTLLTFSGLSFLGGPRWLEGTVLLRKQITASRTVDWLTGACLVVPIEVWDEVGGLTERWFMYAEDLDFGMRIRRSGRKSVVDPAVSISHEVGTGSSTPAPAIEAAWLVNQWDFYRTEMARASFQPAVWKATASIFITARAAAFALMSLTPRRRGLLARSRWLMRCVIALMRHQ